MHLTEVQLTASFDPFLKFVGSSGEVFITNDIRLNAGQLSPNILFDLGRIILVVKVNLIPLFITDGIIDKALLTSECLLGKLKQERLVKAIHSCIVLLLNHDLLLYDIL